MAQSSCPEHGGRCCNATIHYTAVSILTIAMRSASLSITSLAALAASAACCIDFSRGSDDTAGLHRIEGVTVFLDHPELTGRDLLQAVRGYEKRGAIVYERVASSIYSRRMLESFGMSGAPRSTLLTPILCDL